MRKTFMPALMFIAAVAFTSCSESGASAEEKVEISRMDSVSDAVKDSTERLDKQTKKVEEALEKLDKEFPSDNQTK